MPPIKRVQSGERYGMLTAIEPTDQRYRTCVIWRCKCDCGNESFAPSYFLTHGMKKSCGCLRDASRRVDATGRKCGKLTAIRPTGDLRNGKSVWEWKCECGAFVYKTLAMVGNNNSTMCPKCAWELKTEQAEKARTRINRDPDGVATMQRYAILTGKPVSNSSTGIRGVSARLIHGKQKYIARIGADRGVVSVGTFDSPEAAKRAWMRAARRYHVVHDRIIVTLPAGMEAELKSRTTACGLSLNDYILRAVQDYEKT